MIVAVGPFYPSIEGQEDVGTTWGNDPTYPETNVTGPPDGSLTSAGIDSGSTSLTFVLQGYGFDSTNLPGTITPLGVKIDVHRKSSNASVNIVDYHLLMSSDLGSPSSDKADTTTAWGTTLTEVDYGGTTDVATFWGISPAAGFFYDGNSFAVRFAAQNTGPGPTATAFLDTVGVTVYYDDGTSPPPATTTEAAKLAMAHL